MEQKENATPMEHVIPTGQQVVGDTLKWIGFDLDDTLHFYRKASGQACEAVFQYLYEEFGAPQATLRAKYGGILKTAQSGSFAEGKTSRDYRGLRFRSFLTGIWRRCSIFTTKRSP